MDLKEHIRRKFNSGQRVFVPSDLSEVGIHDPKEQLTLLLNLYSNGFGFLTLQVDTACAAGHPIWSGKRPPPPDPGPCPTCGLPSRYANYTFFLAKPPSSTTPTPDASPGERLYCAYNRGGDPATAGLNFRGDPCPNWADLPDNIRAKWLAVVAEAIGVIEPDAVDPKDPR